MKISLLLFCLIAINQGAFAMASQPEDACSYRTEYHPSLLRSILLRIDTINKKIDQDKLLPSQFAPVQTLNGEPTTDMVSPCMGLTNRVLQNAIKTDKQQRFFDKIKQALGLIREKPYHSLPLDPIVTQADYVGLVKAFYEEEYYRIHKEKYHYLVDKTKDQVVVYSKIKTKGSKAARDFDDLAIIMPSVMYGRKYNNCQLKFNEGRVLCDSITTAMLDSYTKCIGQKYNEHGWELLLERSDKGDAQEREYWCKTVMPYNKFAKYFEEMRNK